MFTPNTPLHSPAAQPAPTQLPLGVEKKRHASAKSENAVFPATVTPAASISGGISRAGSKSFWLPGYSHNNNNNDNNNHLHGDGTVATVEHHGAR